MSCMGLNSTELQEARDYFKQLLLPFSSSFTMFHNYIYVFLCVVGVFANISIVVVLLRPAMRKSPFNLFLVVIAVCDASLMATYLTYKHVELCHPWYFSFPWAIYTKFYAIFSVFVHSCSLWLTVNMAILRFLVLYRGSRSDTIIPQCNGFGAAFTAIILAFAIACIGCLPIFIRYRIIEGEVGPVPDLCLEGKYSKDWKPTDMIRFYGLSQPLWWNCDWERINYWMAALILKLIPCLLLTIFMTLLVRMLIEARERRSRLCGGMGNGNSQAERTTAMLTGIVAIFLITELPQGVLTFAAGANPRLTFLTLQMNNVFDLLSLINSAVNFVLCALMSHVFRREFLQTFGVCCPQSSENHSGAPINKTSNRSILSTFSNIAKPKSSKKNGFLPVPTNCPEDKNTVQLAMN
ncbi:hypothetical protein CAEBREN_10708 [Caenorhabditis brenneri]|uniref:G-protein coupled receptors family 1 profile domain-containing protein n=2 Tax=Caenorhabditis brenneri TaxID=135651 RepID=G0NLE6_CAEBE|nr:hypothetical protein CAEBREN_10708 [Caenorhabditis brenneri]